MALAEQIRPMLAGLEADVQGAALATLFAGWLVKGGRLDNEVLERWLKLVRLLADEMLRSRAGSCGQ